MVGVLAQAVEAVPISAVLEHVPPLAAILVAIGGVIVGVIKAWQTLLATVERIVTRGIDTHVREHHAADSDWRNEQRRALERLSDEIRGVHRRIDDVLVGKEE